MRLRRLQPVLFTLLLLPVLGGGLGGLRVMHEAIAHGDGEGGTACEIASACHHAHHVRRSIHSDDKLPHGHLHTRSHAPSGVDSARCDESGDDIRSSSEDARDHEPGHDHSTCLSCDLLAVMVVGDLDPAEVPFAFESNACDPDRVVRTPPLAVLSPVRARPPPVC